MALAVEGASHAVLDPLPWAVGPTAAGALVGVVVSGQSTSWTEAGVAYAQGSSKWP